MTYEYKEVQSCLEHGLVLSPEGTCVRCRTLAGRANRRAEITRVVAGGLFGTALLGGTAAWAHARTPHEVASAPVTREMTLGASSTRGMATMDVTEFPAESRGRVTSPATHAVLRAWERELARVDGKQFRQDVAHEMKVKAKANVQQQKSQEPVVAAAAPASATVYPVVHPKQLAMQPAAPAAVSSEDHPSWWKDPPLPKRGCRRVVQRQVIPDATPGANGLWTPTNDTL